MLRAVGVHVEIGIIVGLPGDTADTAKRTAEWVIENQLGHLDVYRLQVLPGSEYRNTATDIGLQYDERPPYYVRGTTEMRNDQISDLHSELQGWAREANEAYAIARG